MRLNAYKPVNIPSNDWFFGRPMVNVPDSAYTGDETAILPQNKIDSIAEADAEFQDQLNND